MAQDSVRLITLFGPGGVGKTRLAVRVSHELRERFRGRLWFVECAPLNHPALVLPTIVQSIGMDSNPMLPVEERIGALLGDESSLVVLDNLEHLTGAAPEIARLLGFCPKLRILTTSRALLRISGEHSITVPPFAVPDHEAPPTAISRLDSTRLFIERAATRSNTRQRSAPSVADCRVCRWRSNSRPIGSAISPRRRCWRGSIRV